MIVFNLWDPSPYDLFGKDWKPAKFVYEDTPPTSNSQLNWHLYGRDEAIYLGRDIEDKVRCWIKNIKWE